MLTLSLFSFTLTMTLLRKPENLKKSLEKMDDYNRLIAVNCVKCDCLRLVCILCAFTGVASLTLIYFLPICYGIHLSNQSNKVKSIFNKLN